MRVIMEANKWDIEVIAHYDPGGLQSADLVIETEESCSGNAYLNDETKVKVVVPMSIHSVHELQKKLDYVVGQHIRENRKRQAEEISPLEKE